MMDAIERARAERRLTVKLFAVLLVVVAAIYGLLVRSAPPLPTASNSHTNTGAPE
ncbi:MAG: hypothetical protein AMXMBFR82_09540 [Candidatus Hydrogenedentota bacterium]